MLWLLVALTGCDDCPGTEIEVRSFTGAEVIGTAAECEGDLVTNWHVCFEAGRAGVVVDPSWLGDCDDLAIAINTPFIGEGLVLWLGGHGSVEYARAQITYSNDEDDPPPPLPAILSGYVAAEEVARSGRNRGRYELVFEDATIRGAYDTSPP